MIHLEHINKLYQTPNRPPHQALTDINLDIKKGTIYGIIGRSGAGKSTLIRLLNLLERPTSGQIVYNGQEISHLQGDQLRKLRHKIGMVFQHFNLLSSNTVLDNVCLPLRLVGKPKAEREARAKELLHLVGLSEHLHKYPSQLSGGQKQRVGIARALANNPDLLLCDEATSALDPETTQSILALLQDINERFGITIVLITHSMDVIRSICDEVAVLDNGQLVEEGQVIDVFLNPQHPTTQSLLSESSGMDDHGWKRLASGLNARIVRLNYRGDCTGKPIITEIAHQLGADISILQGTVGQIKDTAYGQLVVAINAPEEQQSKIGEFLKVNHVDYEVLKA